MRISFRKCKCNSITSHHITSHHITISKVKFTQVKLAQLKFAASSFAQVQLAQVKFVAASSLANSSTSQHTFWGSFNFNANLYNSNESLKLKRSSRFAIKQTNEWSKLNSNQIQNLAYLCSTFLLLGKEKAKSKKKILKLIDNWASRHARIETTKFKKESQEDRWNFTWNDIFSYY